MTVRSMQERLLAPLSDHHLAYYAGKDYEEAVRMCLTVDFRVDMDDRAELQLALQFIPGGEGDGESVTRAAACANLVGGGAAAWADLVGGVVATSLDARWTCCFLRGFGGEVGGAPSRLPHSRRMPDAMTAIVVRNRVREQHPRLFTSRPPARETTKKAQPEPHPSNDDVPSRTTSGKFFLPDLYSPSTETLSPQQHDRDTCSNELTAGDPVHCPTCAQEGQRQEGPTIGLVYPN